MKLHVGKWPEYAESALIGGAILGLVYVAWQFVANEEAEKQAAASQVAYSDIDPNGTANPQSVAATGADTNYTGNSLTNSSANGVTQQIVQTANAAINFVPTYSTNAI